MLDPALLVDLYPHQTAELLDLLSSTAHRALLWEMGCGKTPVAARLYWGMLLAGPIGQLLYLCPAGIKQQVARELRRWGPPGLRIQILQTRADRLNPIADAVICSFDLLLGNDLYEQLLAQAWLLLVIDELHLLRTPTAERTRRIFGQQPCLAGAAQRVLALTGTPIVNSPLDLFPLVNRLFPHAIAFEGADGKPRRMQQGEFEQKYCVRRQVHIGGGRTVERIVGGQNLPELRERLAPYVSRLRRDEVLDLPPITIADFALTVEINDAVAAAMAAPPHALVQALKRADDNTFLYLLQRHAAELAALRRLIGTVKAGAAAEHILHRLEGGEDRIVAFVHHRDAGDIVLDHLRNAGVAAAMIRGDTPAAARTHAVDALTDHSNQVLLLQNQAGSLGLNLQACRRVVIIEPSWTDAETKQSISRIYRAGQTRNCFVEFLMLPGSLDEHVVSVARRKAAIAASLIEPPIKEEVECKSKCTGRNSTR